MSFSIKVDVSEVVDYFTHLAENLEQLEDALVEAISEGMLEILVMAKARAPVVTGRYRDSIHLEHLEDGISIVADAVDPVYDFGYAPKVEEIHHVLGLSVEEGLPIILFNIRQKIKDMAVRQEIVRGGKTVTVYRNPLTGRFVPAPR